MRKRTTRLSMRQHRCRHDYNDQAFCRRCGHSLRNPQKRGWRWKTMTRCLWDLD